MPIDWISPNSITFTFHDCLNLLVQLLTSITVLIICVISCADSANDRCNAIGAVVNTFSAVIQRLVSTIRTTFVLQLSHADHISGNLVAL